MAELLAVIWQIDPRFKIDSDAVADLAVDVWYRVVGGLDAADALDVVVDYYRETRDRRIMPADLSVGVREIRRIRRADLPPADVLMADVPYEHPRYDAIYRERVTAGMDRPADTTPPALPAR